MADPGLEWVQCTHSKPPKFLRLMAIREGPSDRSLGSIMYLEISKNKCKKQVHLIFKRDARRPVCPSRVPGIEWPELTISSRENIIINTIFIFTYIHTRVYMYIGVYIYIYTYIHILSYYFSILYLERFPRKKLEIANAPEYSLLGGGILRFGLLFLLIKEKESPAQRARANRFLNVF
jgi:hypothetical protein